MLTGLLKVAEQINPQVQQEQQQPAKHPFLHTLGILGGGYLGYKGFRGAYDEVSGIDNLDEHKKQFKTFQKEYFNYLKDKENIGENLQRYMNENSIKSADDAYKHMMNEHPVYSKLNKARGFKALGILGLGIGAYNTYKLLTNDINNHPVVENI